MHRPRPVVLSLDTLHSIKISIDNDSIPHLSSSLNALVQQADNALLQGPWSVINKKRPSPSGDNHDYVSQAPYWWPSDTPDGLPYIRRDGLRNPETFNYTDKADRANVFNASFILALAWFYTGESVYASHAANIIRTWFVTPKTRMTPHLQYAQFIPGVNEGRAIGIIDFSLGYTSVLDAAAILASEGAKEWTEDDANGFRQWNVEFLDWLRFSPFGIEESEQQNNHGTFAIMQKAAIALFIDDKATVLEEVEAIKRHIDLSFCADGSQPLELTRTRSWHYSCFSLTAFIRMAEISSKIGVDLWSHYGSEGQNLHTAVNFLIPAATGAAEWKSPEIEFMRFAASDVIRASAAASNEMARKAVRALELPTEDFWHLRPAPEQLDNVK